VTLGDRPQALGDSVHLVFCRVTGTTQAEQPVARLTEALRNGLRVEIAMGGEDPSPCQPDGDLRRGDLGDDQRDRRRPRRPWGRAE